jgi:hypothetical protein
VACARMACIFGEIHVQIECGRIVTRSQGCTSPPEQVIVGSLRWETTIYADGSFLSAH